MNTKLVMTASALVMGITGVVLIFMPQEVQRLFHASANAGDVLLVQIIGGLYFAFAMINWTSKANLIGGIYGRPIAIGNLTHFSVGALSLLKGYAGIAGTSAIVVTAIYAVFAVLFGIIFFTHPVPEKSTQQS